MKFHTIFNTTALVCLTLSGAAVAQTEETALIDIPQQDLARAIEELSNETGVSVSVLGQYVEGKTSKTVAGMMPVHQALAQMLDDPDLIVQETADGSLVVTRKLNFNVSSQNTEEQPFDLGRITVTTARRTLENVDDVPGSVIVLGSEALEDSNIADFFEAVEFLPNVNVGTNSDPRRGYISIRGISALNFAAASPTIGVFQNGVLQNGTGLRFNINPSLRDLERVEVLYGPQGTAFGRGTIGGAINFVTAKPVFETQASLQLSYTDLNEFDGEAVINTPLSETVAVRAVLYGNDAPGFIDTPNAPQTSTIGSENAGARVSLRWQPTDQLTVDASIQHDELDYDGQFFADDASVLAGNPLQRSNTVPGLEVERTNFLLDVSYQTDFGRIISTTGYLESNLAGVEDFDLGPDPNQILSRDNFEDTFSQEFRFESNEFDVGTGTLTFNLGLNYSETSAETQSDFEALIDFSGLGPGASNTIFTRDVENRSIFGDVRWQATPQLEIAVGARYSVDDVRVRTQALRTGSLAGFGSPTFVRDADFDAFLPSISVLYDWNDSFSTFASYAKGYKPGGFTAQSGALGQFEEEFADSYELGLRYVGFDDRLRLRATLFYVDYTDIQVPIRQDPANGFFGGVENAAGAESQGFELSFSTDPLPGLTIEGAFGYTDATFTNYAGSSFGDLTGFSLPNAPDRTYSLIVDYEFQNKFRGLTPFVRGEFNGTSGFRPEAINFNEVGDYNLVNLRTGFRGENVDLTLFVENLFDETYAVDGFSTFLSPGAPRTYGIVASYRF